MQSKPAKQPNVSSDEIQKFDALSSKWWDLNGEFNALHRINPLRLQYIATHSNGLSGKHILDVGCGGGILSESMAKEGAIVTGLDMAHDVLNIAKEHAKLGDLDINYIQDTVEAHAQQQTNHYDVVTCMEMLEHVPDPQSVISACVRLVKPGGHLFFATINRNIKAWLLLIAGAEYITRMVPKGTHDPKKFIRPSELIAWIENNPAQVTHTAGIQYHILQDTFAITNNVDTNYMLHAIKVSESTQ